MKEDAVKELTKTITDILSHVNSITSILKEGDKNKAKEFIVKLDELLNKYMALYEEIKREGKIVV